mmetsp:Transcript_4691/g.11662  ORF Transcript_4691/g.11662 Transcript_4691/m.11662 type:complete len:146 (+) Transcript_4691:103-540(+)
MSSETDAAIKDAFEVFDKDKNGYLMGIDMPTLIRCLGKVPSDEEAEQLIKDAGGPNAKVNLSKATQLAKQKYRKPMDLEREMRQAFSALDKDGNGQIRDAELRQILSTMGKNPLTPAEVEMMIRELHVNEDGTILYDEFVSLLTA